MKTATKRSRAPKDNWNIVNAYSILAGLPPDPDEAMSVVEIVLREIKKARPAPSRVRGWKAVTADIIRQKLPTDTKQALSVIAIVKDAIENITRPHSRRKARRAQD